MVKTSRTFRLNVICLALMAAVAGPVCAADDAQQLEQIVVKGKKQGTRKENEVTGLGKLVKNTGQLNKEQVMGIRDLTRYDPGISVVEQGRGATTGYSIRGMDQNRIGILVDGVPQIQSYSAQYGNRPLNTSGAINEIEYENVRSIEISKGASSSEYGNGSLGGSVSFRSKEAQDIIKDGQNWGLDLKTAYGSKNRLLTNSAAFAGRLKNFEGLAVYTHRDGHEIEAHSDAGKTDYTVTTIAKEPDPRGISFITPENCTSGNQGCTVSQAMLLKAGEEKTLSGKDYTGSKRLLPDLMDYKTDSWFLKGGFNLGRKHYIGGVYEHTKQKYDIRDMRQNQLWTTDDPLYKELTGKLTIQELRSYYLNSNQDLGRFIDPNENKADLPADGVFPAGTFPNGIGLKYSRTRFVDEHHLKTRKGLLYRYTDENRNSWADNFSLSYDRQFIGLDTHVTKQNCAVYPEVDKNCHASADKPWSYNSSDRFKYSEKHDLLQLNWQKEFQAAATKHDVAVNAGYDKFSSELARTEYFREQSGAYWQSQGRGYVVPGTAKYDYYTMWSYLGTRYNRWEYCTTVSCESRRVHGKGYYLSARDNMSLGKYFDVGIGARYDYRKMHSDDEWTSSGKIENFSWNAGFVFKPNRHMAVSYRASTGFRVPSFAELFGRRVPGWTKEENNEAQKRYITPYEAEKSLNRELGLMFKGDWGNVELSYFRNRYRGLFTTAEIIDPRDGIPFAGEGYFNIQNVDLSGFNIVGKVDWNGLWKKAPEGLYSTVAYNRVNVNSMYNNPGYTYVGTPLLDALQPPRFVIGVGYDHPEGKWGVNSTMTYSFAKDEEGLHQKFRQGGDRNRVATDYVTKKWYTFDVSGYVSFRKYFTLRAGVYNLFNRRYTTWEAVRQTSRNGVVRHDTDSDTYTRYAAPGRNYALTLEMKF